MYVNESLIDLVTWTPQIEEKINSFCDPNQRLWAIDDEGIQSPEDQALFQNILIAFGLEKMDHTGSFDFGFNFSSKISDQFKVSSTHHVQHMLTLPPLHQFRTNGTLKKTLWHYALNLGMIQISTT